MKLLRGVLVDGTLVPGALFALLWASSDVATSRYPNLYAACADQLSERGCMPDILRPSATDIKGSNDLDVGISGARSISIRRVRRFRCPGPALSARTEPV